MRMWQLCPVNLRSNVDALQVEYTSQEHATAKRGHHLVKEMRLSQSSLERLRDDYVALQRAHNNTLKTLETTANQLDHQNQACKDLQKQAASAWQEVRALQQECGRGAAALVEVRWLAKLCQCAQDVRERTLYACLASGA